MRLPTGLEGRSSHAICLMLVVIALAIRLTVMAFLYHDNLDPARDHWNMGYEQGRVARSIATGKGFASPLFGDTGPTAWPAPLYPLLMAGVFKLFGVYTPTSGIVITSLNCLFSALTCVPIFLYARQSFGQRTALLAASFWVIFPYAVYWSVMRIWDTWLSSLLVSLVFLVALQLERREAWWYWAGWGLLCGVTALCGPVVLAILPGLGLWGVYGLHRRHRPWLLPAIASALCCIALVGPWMFRNYRIFHQFVPVRDSMGLEFKLGNSGDNSRVYDINAGPWTSDLEWQKFREQGELAYFEEKGREAFAFIRAHPKLYAVNTLRRVVNIWTDFWSLSPKFLEREPYSPLVALLCTALSVFTIWGLWRALRADAFHAMPYLLVLLFYPMVYYFTHTADWYRRPIDPLFVVLASFALSSYWPFEEPKQAAERAELEELVVSGE